MKFRLTMLLGATAAILASALTVRAETVLKWAQGTRNIGPADLVHNCRLGHVDVDARTGRVTFEGRPCTPSPAESVSLSRLYFL